MKFGKVENADGLDLSLPLDHPETKRVFEKGKSKGKPQIYIGCSRWGKSDLKNFYPKGIKDELTYYSTQFNSVELNASFYRIFPPEQFEKWKNKTPENFKFFPKIPQEISHFKQLNNVKEAVDRFLNSVVELDEKLGTIFLQLKEQFGPNRFDLLQNFVENWPIDLPLTIELRHRDWFNDPIVSNELYQLLEENNITNTLVDTAGRRDLMHMRMTTPKPFIRYVGANHHTDATRLLEWTDRIGEWINQGMEELHFFVHQNMEEASPILAADFIKVINEKFGYDLHIPEGKFSQVTKKIKSPPPSLFD